VRDECERFEGQSSILWHWRVFWLVAPHVACMAFLGDDIVCRSSLVGLIYMYRKLLVIGLVDMHG